MATIFLSHSSLNNSQAIAVRDWLASEGWDDVFLDLDPERGIRAGERWQESLKRASSTCELVILLISPAWAASKWCLAEFLLAKQMNKRIFAATVEKTPFESIPVELTAEWQIVDLAEGKQKRALSVVSTDGGPPATVHFAEDGLDRLKTGLLSSGLDPKFFPWPPEDDPDRPPYRGLRALEEEDAGIFFGREGSIVDGLDLLRGLRDAAPPRMLVILGASGAGKSSYMRAGLLPRLQRDSRYYRVLPVVRPHNAVLEGDAGLISAIDGALRRVGSPVARAEIRAAVAAGAPAITDLLAPVAGKTVEDGPPPMFVLPIDQGEELFLAEGAEEAQAFRGLLRDLLLLETHAFTAIVTIRSDSYEPLQTAPALEGIAQQTYSLPPMPRGAHGEVILGPARRLSESSGQFEIDAALVDALLADVEQNSVKDGLPLLAFTLERLYRDYGANRRLKLAEYERTGRIRGSIEAAVEQALKAADDVPGIPRDKAARLRLLRRAMIPALAGVDPDTGTPRRRIARLEELPAESRPLVRLLVDQRLLSTDVSPETGETTVEPAHEALLRQWDMLKGWLEEETEDLAMAESVRRAARDWQANGREGEWLVHAGGRLQLADVVAAREDFGNLFTAPEREYLLACREAEDARRAAAEAARLRELAAQKQRRNIFAGAFAVSLVLLGLAGWQWWEAGQQRAAAEDEARRARHAAAGGLAALSTIETEQNNIVKAAKLALAAWPRNSERDDPRLPEVLENLSAVLPRLVDGEWRRGETPPRMRAEFDRDGKLYALSDGSELVLRDSPGGEVRQRFQVNPYGEGFAFSPDGRWFAATEISSKPRTDLLRTDAPDDPRVLHARSGSPRGFDFSADGAQLAIAEDSGAIVIHELNGNVAPRFQEVEENLWDLALSPDGSLIATVTLDAVRIYDGANGEQRGKGFDGRRGSPRWVTPGRLVVISPENLLKIISLPDGEEFEDTYTAQALSPDSRLLALGHPEGVVELANAAVDFWEQDNTRIVLPDAVEIRSLNFASDDRSLLIGDSHGSVWLWDLVDSALTARFDGRSAHVAAASMRGSNSIVVGRSDGSVDSFDIEEPTVRWHTLPFPDDAEVRLSPDGAYIAAWVAEGRIEIRQVTETLPVVRTLERAIPEGERRSFALSPSATMVAFWTQSGVEMVLLDGETADGWLAPVEMEWGHPYLSFSSDGRHLGVAYGTRGFSSASLLDTTTGEILLSLEGSTPRWPDVGIEFSPGGEYVIFRNMTDWLQIPEPDGVDATPVREFATETASTQWGFGGTDPAYSLDATRLAAPDEGAISLFDMATGVRILRLRGRGSAITELAYDPDGSRFVSLHDDGTLGIWRIPQGLSGDAFAIACRHLPDAELAEAVSGYPVEIDEPICGLNDDPPMPSSAWSGQEGLPPG